MKPLINLNSDSTFLKRACQKLATIQGYKDSDELLARYEGILADYEKELAQKREETARQKAIKIKKAKKASFFTVLSSVIVTGILLLTFLFLIPNRRQGDICKMIDAGKYQDASTLIEKNGYFGNTKKLIAMNNAGKAFDSLDYETGIDYIYKIGGTVDVSYDNNGGTSNTKIEQIKKVANPYISNDAAKNGYDFHGWLLTGYKIDSENYFASINLKAQYDIVTYSISYDLNGGECSEDLPSSYTTEETVAIPNPTRVGYTFTGWTSDTDSTSITDFKLGKGSVGNRNLKANWIANQYTVTLDLNGGTSPKSSYTITYDSHYTIAVPTRVGYTFSQFTYDNDIPFQLIGTWTLTKDITIKANWIANTDTKYVVNHYTENLDGKGYTKVDTQNLEGTSDSTVSIDANTYEGFTAQTESQTKTIAADGTTVIDFYYTRNSYTISFVTNGGNKIESKSFKYEETIPSDLKPTRANYTFAGWYTDEKQTTLFDKMPAMDQTVYAYYSEETKASFFDYDKNEDSVTITKGKNLTGDVVIPEYIGGKLVTSIGPSSFENCTSLVTIGIPDSIISICYRAFYDCRSLANVVIPGSVTFIGYAAFGGCTSLTSVTIPDSVIRMQTSVFLGCTSLKKVIIRNGVTSIDGNSFMDCTSLAGIEIPGSVASIGNGAFYRCTSLTSVIIRNGVTSIGNSAFYGCKSLVNIEIPGSVYTIGDSAFAGCKSLVDIVIPASVTYIMADAFSGCTSLTIYCEAESEPAGWHYDWKPSDTPVVWGYKR